MVLSETRVLKMTEQAYDLVEALLTVDLLHTYSRRHNMEAVLKI